MGMGVTFVLALLMVVLAYLALTPGTLARLGLGWLRLDLRVKMLNGYALAFMLLALGFFLAGVPLEGFTGETAVTDTPEAVASNGSGQSGMFIPTSTPGGEAEVQTPEMGTPETDGSAAGEEENGEDEGTAVAQSGAFVPQPTATGTVTATVTPTLTPTPSPTPSPTPTMTPTPIDGETAVIDAGGAGTWMYRSPGGQRLLPLQNQEVVLVYPGHANRTGLIWRQVAKGDGTLGWVEEQFLTFEDN